MSSTDPTRAAMLKSLKDKGSLLVLNAQRMIAEKMRLTEELATKSKLAAAAAGASVDAYTQPNVPQSVLETRVRAAQLSAQIAEKLAASSALKGLSVAPTSNKPAPLILNSEGRILDDSGREVQLIRQPTLKANQRTLKREPSKSSVNNSGTHTTTGFATPTSGNSTPAVSARENFFDSRLSTTSSVPLTRPRRTFHFVEKGTFERLGSQIRTKAALQKLQKEIAEKVRKTGISSAARFALLSSILPKKETKKSDIPDVEWWDRLILKHETYDECIESTDLDPSERFHGVTNLIEHPSQLKVTDSTAKPLVLQIFMTKKERKKLRRQNRREALKEKQEKIRLGLEPPPEPKLKMSNMMRVLGQEAVQDPTKIEAQVRAQMLKRMKAHEAHNAERKLSAEARRAKKIEKIKRESQGTIHVTVYKVRNLMNPAKKFKVETNATQLMLTGVGVLFKDTNVVVVEGSLKHQKKFKRLMMNRIKWDEDSEGNRCELIWEGIVSKKAFNNFSLKVSPNESFAREYFKNHGVESYWDLAFSTTVLQSEGDAAK